jgi:hypothetical protein
MSVQSDPIQSNPFSCFRLSCVDAQYFPQFHCQSGCFSFFRCSVSSVHSPPLSRSPPRSHSRAFHRLNLLARPCFLFVFICFWFFTINPKYISTLPIPSSKSTQHRLSEAHGMKQRQMTMIMKRIRLTCSVCPPNEYIYLNLRLDWPWESSTWRRRSYS